MRNVSKATLACWLWFVLPLAVAGETMDDPILAFLPKGVRIACEDAFPAHRALRAVERTTGGAKVYRLTVFSPADTMVYHKKTGDDLVSELPLYPSSLPPTARSWRRVGTACPSPGYRRRSSTATAG